MEAFSASPPSDADLEQIGVLCDNLSERVESAREEQALLAQLVATTARVRPFRSRQYRALLDGARERYRRLHNLLIRYCR